MVGEIPLSYKLQIFGAEAVKQKLKEIDDQFVKGTLTKEDAAIAYKELGKQSRDFVNIQRTERNILLATHPELNKLTRGLSAISSISRTALSISNSLNLMWLRQGSTSSQLATLNHELSAAQRDYNKALASGDLEKQAEALERIGIAQAKIKELSSSETNQMISDVVTTISGLATAISSTLLLLTKNPDFIKNLFKSASAMGGLFGGIFTGASAMIMKAGTWITTALGIGTPAGKASALAGTRLGTIFGLSFAGALSVVIIAVGAAILAGAIDIMMENVSGQSFVRSLTEKLLGKGKGMSVKDILGINEYNGADLSGQGVFGGPNSYQDYIGGSNQGQNQREGRGLGLPKKEEIEEQVSIWQPVIDLFTKTIPEALGVAKDGFFNMFKATVDLTNLFGAGLVSGVNSIFGELINSMNQAISSYNKAAKKMGKSTISSLSFTPSSFTPIPAIAAARGFSGIVSSPTMFLAGEAGPESVNITPRGKSGGGPIIINNIIYGSVLAEREVARIANDSLKDGLKRRGNTGF